MAYSCGLILKAWLCRALSHFVMTADGKGAGRVYPLNSITAIGRTVAEEGPVSLSQGTQLMEVLSASLTRK